MQVINATGKGFILISQSGRKKTNALALVSGVEHLIVLFRGEAD